MFVADMISLLMLGKELFAAIRATIGFDANMLSFDMIDDSNQSLGSQTMLKDGIAFSTTKTICIFLVVNDPTFAFSPSFFIGWFAILCKEQ